MTTTRTDQAAFLRHRWETPMTTTPPAEGNEPRECGARHPGTRLPCVLPTGHQDVHTFEATDRPSPPVPAAEDDAVEQAARALHDEGVWCGECEFDGWDSCPECRRVCLTAARAALDAAGVGDLTAAEMAAQFAYAERAGRVAAEQYRPTPDAFRDLANMSIQRAMRAEQQVADLRAGIEALAAYYDATSRGDVAHQVRVLLAGSGEQAGEDSYTLAVRAFDEMAPRPAPVVTDSTGLRERVVMALANMTPEQWALSSDPGRRYMVEHHGPAADRVLAVVGQGVTAEQAWDECVQAMAWAMDNGPDPLAYVREHNPFRATPTGGGAS